MTEIEFYKKKIFDKVSITQIKTQHPDFLDSINNWYKSDNYKKIQKYKSYLTHKFKQIPENLNNDELYNIVIWMYNTPKVCYYCSLPESTLEELHNQQGHRNKRYPKRGKSLEIDRKQANLPYNDIENLVLACYWCNNAKTDTFTEDEFRLLGKEIKKIWENRLNRQL
jgi:5-methylcytosine-specific restriction endonuclease McrA